MNTSFIENTFNGDNLAIPFKLEQIDSVLFSDSSASTDLIYHDDINCLVLDNYQTMNITPKISSKDYFEIHSKDDVQKLINFGLTEEFSMLIYDFLKEMKCSLLGIQITSPGKVRCPKVHVDKLPLRIVQCLNGVGTTLVTPEGRVIETKKNDVIFLKGDLWKSRVGAIQHKSPESDVDRMLLRIDFLD